MLTYECVDKAKREEPSPEKPRYFPSQWDWITFIKSYPRKLNGIFVCIY